MEQTTSGPLRESSKTDPSAGENALAHLTASYFSFSTYLQKTTCPFSYDSLVIDFSRAFIAWANRQGQSFSHFLSSIDPVHLIGPLAHKSFVHEFPLAQISSYQRSEFLGDAVLNVLITDLLMAQYPTDNEGVLSRYRAALINADGLFELASCIGLQDLALVGKGEERGACAVKNILADMFEAVIGQLYTVYGIEQARSFLSHVLNIYQTKNNLAFINQDRFDQFDAKTRLQEWSLAHWRSIPRYSVQAIENQFSAEVWLNGKKMAMAFGPSKKAAEMAVARTALNIIKTKETKTKLEY